MLPYAAKVTRTPWWILFCHRPAKFSKHCHTVSHDVTRLQQTLRSLTPTSSSSSDACRLAATLMAGGHHHRASWRPRLESVISPGSQIQIQIISDPWNHGIHDQIMEYCGQQCFGYFWILPNTGLVRLVNLCTAFFDLPRQNTWKSSRSLALAEFAISQFLGSATRQLQDWSCRPQEGGLWQVLPR